MNPKTFLEFRKRWIKWVLDFIQTDLGPISKIEKKRLAQETVYFCSRDLFQTPWEDWGNIIMSPKASPGWNKLFDRMESQLDQIQQVLKSFMNGMEDLAKPMMDYYPLPSISMEMYVDWVMVRRDFNEGYFDYIFFPQDDKEENWAILNFRALILGLEVHSIKRCKGCNRYFLNISKKEKIYCNSACASRSITHKRYEDLKKHTKKYEAHLRKYRKLSKERYRRLREMQFGPNVKIQKRRNHKKEG